MRGEHASAEERRARLGEVLGNERACCLGGLGTVAVHAPIVAATGTEATDFTPNGLFRTALGRCTLIGMKAALAVTAVLSVLAIGAIPALGLTPGTADEPAVVTAALVSGKDGLDRDRDRETGPPPWAHGHGHAKPAKPAKPGKPVKADRQDGRREAPPGWSKHPGKIRGHGHGMAMRAWAHCVGEATRRAR